MGMNRESCIQTIELLRKLALNIHGIIDVIDDRNCNDIITMLKEQEDRHRLEVHNIGNVDIPEGVSEEHFYLVMNNVAEALQHTDKGESYPYEDTGR